jgi:Cft2 family RNA processing exonuclease
MKMLLQDYLRVSTIETEDMLYDSKDLEKCVKKIKPIDYHQSLEHHGIKFECYNAGWKTSGAPPPSLFSVS